MAFISGVHLLLPVDTVNRGQTLKVVQFNWGGMATPTEYDVPWALGALHEWHLDGGTDDNEQWGARRSTVLVLL